MLDALACLLAVADQRIVIILLGSAGFISLSELALGLLPLVLCFAQLSGQSLFFVCDVSGAEWLLTIRTRALGGDRAKSLQ